MGRVQKPDEPYFTEQDTEAVLAHMHEKQLACSGCGLPRDETMSKEAQFLYFSEPMRCHACAARDRAAEQFTKTEHDAAGMYYTIEED